MKRILLLCLFAVLYLNSLSQYTYIGATASQQGCHAFTVTTAIGNQKGAVWNNTPINLNTSFDFNFDVFLGCNNASGQGADGMVFVLQNSGLAATGNPGGDIGFGGMPGNSLGIEMDTWQNGSACPTDRLDPVQDHIAILKNGSTFHCSANNIAGPVVVAGGVLADCQYHSFRVKWDAVLKVITVYFDGTQILSTPLDIITSIFLGNPTVYWGFVASTGGAVNEHKFRTALTPTFHFPPGQKLCVNQPIQFIDSTVSFAPITKFYWNFGDGSGIDSVNLNPVHTYTAGGTYTVTQTVIGADGCSEVNTQQVTIGNKPIAAFTNQDSCVDIPIHYIDNSTVAGGTISSYFWDLGNSTTSNVPSPTATYNTYGLKTVRMAVTSAAGCLSDTLTKLVKIRARPVVDFNFTDSVCFGSPTFFFDNSTLPDGPVNGWIWHFDDTAFNSNAKDPVHIFLTPGSHPVWLMSTGTGNADCLGAMVQKNVFVRSKPIAYFKTNTICQSATTVLTDSSYIPGGGAITNWWWDLGNGNFSTQQNPTVTYNTAGPVTIRLVVSGAAGCKSDTLTVQLNVNGKPTAAFTYADTCVNTLVHFFDVSTVAGSSVNTYYWDLGNATTAAIANPTATYTAYGIKTIRLAVKSLEGCASDTLIKTINVRAQPVGNFSFTDSVCLGSPTFFFDNSTLADGPILTWSWLYGDSASAGAGQNPVHIFLAPGNHVVRMTASGSNPNCASSPVQKNVFVVDKPKAYFKSNNICQSVSNTLTDSSYTTDGIPVTGWWWDLGNGNFSTQQNPIVTYNSSGPVTVKLVVVNARGCRSDTFTKLLNVSPKPVAKFGYKNPLCSNVAVQFSDSSTVTGGTITQWTWINNGTVFSTQQNPLVNLPTGLQLIKLVVNTGGCSSDTVFKTLQVNPKPTINFSFKDTCKNTIVNFTASSAGAINQWNWTLGDGTTAAIQNPQHTYGSNGIYPVTLFAVAATGCYSDTLKKDLNIYGTDANAGPDLIAAAGQPVQLEASGGVSYEWIPAIGLNNAFIYNPIATLNSDQTYILKATTPGGCESYDQMTVRIYKGPEIYVPTGFSPNGDGRNDILKAFPVGISKFENFSVFNRYGQKIFSTDDYNKGWDGTFKSAKQNSGVYVWMASAVDFKGNKMFRKGTVMLIR